MTEIASVPPEKTVLERGIARASSLLSRAPTDKIVHEINVGAIADHWLGRCSGYRGRKAGPPSAKKW